MGYENARRHLDPVRDFFEQKGNVHISEAYSSTVTGEPSIILNTTTEFIGAYLRDDKMVVMVRFDDKGIDPMHIDVAYDAVRKRIKTILSTRFPQLDAEDVAVHVMDTSGNVGDFEW